MARPKKYQRDEVINQAMEVFWRKGFAATSLSDLTDCTGLNKRSLYNEFGSKEALFLEALSRYRQLRAPVIEQLTQQPLGLNNIRQLYQGMADAIDCRGCLLALSLNELELLSSDAAGMVQQSLGGIQALVRANLEAENFPPHIEINALASLLSMQLISIASMGKLGMEREQITAAVEQLLLMLPSPLNHPATVENP